MDTQPLPPVPEEKTPPQDPAPTTPEDPEHLIMEALLTQDWKQAEKVLRKNIPVALKNEWNASQLAGYNPLLFLDQSNEIGEEHADRIYTAICGFKQKQDILMILGSKGGRIEPAYLISKNCKAVAKSKFVVAVPRRAKSAATLLALGANEVHMGPMSELGPIDPQLGRIPALSLTNALQTIARLVTEFPGSADMFATYLQKQLDLGILGYFERISESAVQYGSRLLAGKSLPQGRTAAQLATHLVNHYKDHSFVIDKDESMELLGESIVKTQSAEYTFANKIDQNLRWVSRIAKLAHRKVVTFVGGFDSCLKIRELTKDEE